MSISYIFSQILIVVAYSLFGISYITKNRFVVLGCNSASLIAEGMAYFLLSAWSGLAMVLIACFRNILFFGQTKLLEKKPELKKYNWATLVIVWTIAIGAMVATFDSVFSTFSIISSMIYTFSIWQTNHRTYKYLGIVACVFLIGYNIFIGSLFGAIMESLLMIWITITAFTNFKFLLVVKDDKIEAKAKVLPTNTAEEKT